MPMYTMICDKLHKSERLMSFEQFDNSDFGVCPQCAKRVSPSAANNVCVYGTDNYSEKAFKDASGAAGEKITNTKQVDELERSGKMYRITNPSQYRFKNGKKIDNKLQKEKLSKCLDKHLG